MVVDNNNIFNEVNKMVDIIQFVQVGLTIIGGATVIFRIIAPLTENTVDNKILKGLEIIAEKVAFNRDTGKVEIKLANQK